MQVYLFLARLGYRRGAVFILSVLFAVHPALTQAVAGSPAGTIRSSRSACWRLLFRLNFVQRHERGGAALNYMLHLVFSPPPVYERSGRCNFPLFSARIYSCRMEKRIRAEASPAVSMLARAAPVLAAFAIVIRAARRRSAVYQNDGEIFRNTPALIVYFGKLSFR